MTALHRWIPRLITVTAVLHVGWAFAQPHDWSGLVADGFVRANVDTGAASYALREASIWFMAAGIALFALASLARTAVHETGRVPASLGWYLLALGVPLSLVYFPVTGSWALVVIGALSVYAARSPSSPRPTPRAAGPAAPPPSTAR
ncbi:DUF6463 family protein [Jiangella rhizosphaerae]|uniref:Uncharacterized protein n=1 Tax=Jiangella rhizosphaerae TaxID=2293569 RepID=A0A418KQN5_9ACTN|nr:DUF6463 family protein [Jiangella rhizosphaerae]RIQ22870.1 hypothetical protein DY240_13155 [Jiangella rhizosphaerae]